MSNKKIVIKNILSSLSLQGISLIYGFIVPVLIIRTFGSNVNGLVSSITQFLAYIMLLEGGIGPVITNALFKPLVEKNNKELEDILGRTNIFFRKISYIFVIYIVLLCIVYPLLNNNFSILYTVSLILIISVSKFSEYFLGMTYSLFFKADQKNFIIDNINSISYIINLIIIVILVNLNFSIHAIKLISAITFVVKSIAFRLYFNKKYNLKINNQSTYKLEKQWDGVVHHVATAVQDNTDITVLTVFSNLTNVSIYSVYALVTKGIRSVIVSLTNGIDAFFGKKLINKDDEDSVKRNFDIYTFIFYTITTILLSTTLVLIIPFISVYTNNITDANYVIPVFAYLLVFAEFNFVIRYPYSTIVYAKGHFKETRNFSIIEPIVNLILSIVLVVKYGIIGVAIGTLISMPIRSLGFIYYGATKILNNKFINSLKIILVSLFEMILVFGIYLLIGYIQVTNYLQWIVLAIIAFIIIACFVVLINALLFKKIFKDIINIVRRKKYDK